MKKALLLLPLCIMFNAYAAEKAYTTRSERTNYSCTSMPDEIVLSQNSAKIANNSNIDPYSQRNYLCNQTKGLYPEIDAHNYNGNGLKNTKKLLNLLNPTTSHRQKVNVHTARTPYKNIFNRTRKGFAYGFIAGCSLGLSCCAYKQPKSALDTMCTTLVSGIGLGLAEATWYGTRQAVKEFHKRGCDKTHTETLKY